MELYVIRHTRVGIAPGICYGQTDVALADSFEVERDEVRNKLPQSQAFRVYSSPLSRCRRLAESLGSDEIRFDVRLLELNFGDWEMQKWDEIGLGALNAWSEDAAFTRCPNGESFLDQYHRTVAFWNELMAAPDDRPALIITHSGVIRALIAHLLDMPLAKSLQLGVDFGGMTKISFMEHVPIIDYMNR